jgi:hypothetical protein
MKTRFRNPVMFLMAALLCAFVVASCSDDKDATPATDFTALNASITAAQAKLTTTEEGKLDGQYPKASRDALQASITAAQAVVALPTTTQTEADAANTQLGVAMTTYETAKITPIAADALVAHWSFDEGTGTVAHDESTNAFDGTLKNGPQWPKAWNTGVDMPAWWQDRNGTAGKAVHFSGNGGSIEIPYNVKLNPGQITVALWVKADSINKDNRFLGLQSWIGYKFQLQVTNRPFFSAGTVGGAVDEDSEQELPVGEWHHIVATYGNGEMDFYVDGELIKVQKEIGKTDQAFKPISDKPYNLVIGQDFPTDKYYMGDPGNGANFNDPTLADQYHVIPLAWGGHFLGAVDEVRIYNTVLTASQITSIYDREAPANP